MDEQTSESVMDESIDLFADEEPLAEEQTSDFAEEAEEATTQEQTEQEQGSVQTEEPASVLDIVYNGQAMSLTKEQAVTLAQKGMNYDKLQQRLQEAENGREVQLINKLAQKNNVSVDALIASLEQQAEEMEITARANKLMDESYMDLDVARRVAKAEIEKEALQNQQIAAQRRTDEIRQKIEAQNAENQRKRESFNKEIGELTHAYPDFQKKYPTIESMPQIMQDAIRNGESIKAAYQQVVIEEQKQTIAALNQNNKNKLASTGSATGLGATGKDPFLGALFSDD